MICNILSSLRSQLHWQVYPATAKETWQPVDEHQSRPRRRDSYEETLQEIRAACQRVLEAAEVLKSDIERLSWGMRDVPQTHSHSHTRSHSRSCSRSHPRSCSLDRWPRSPSRSQQGRRVTFQELEVELDPKEGGENYPPEPSIVDVETWLDWQTCQLDMPCWWMEPKPSQGWKTHGNSPRRSGPLFWFPKSEAGSSQGKIIPHPLPLSASPRTCSSWMNYLIRMCNNSLFS